MINDSNYEKRLREVWKIPQGLASITAVNHRVIGVRYIVTAFIFFILAGVLALMMVLQLSGDNNNLMSHETYNQFFTMHGTTMMFLFAVPVVEGIAIYLVPLMLGSRDLVFPRLNSFGYFVFLTGGIVVWGSLFLGSAPDAGWFNYVPLAGPEYSPGINIDIYTTAISFMEIAALVAAVELIITIFRVRAPGMSLSRMPLFVWAVLVMSFMIIFAFPPLVLTSIFLAADRMIGTHFFNVAMGGNPLLWQHLFWWFGHPEVYIIAVPAFGMVSTIIPTFSRRPIVGYLIVAISMVMIGVISFGLWVHHMFSSEASILGMSLFAAASMAIALPSGAQVFAWIGTIWDSKRVEWRTPMLWVTGSIVLFTIGGLTGPMLAAIPWNWQVHDTHFVTAHFHYVLVGGAVFPIIGGLYYWFPKVTGRMMSERLGKWSFWLAFTGFNIAFFTLHYTGLMGMPRRVHTYLADQGFDLPMQIMLVGALIFAAGLAITLWNVIASLRHGPPAGDNPWNAPTLEWSTTSPPPAYNFLYIPMVHSANPLWDDKKRGEEGPLGYQTGTDYRETLGTTALDGIPEQRLAVARPSIWPLVLALSVATVFMGSLIDLIFVPIGAVLSFIALVGWNWPGKQRRRGL
ncbi:MAG: cbb3-type cytochrome c oxidase subunit I [Dehalococcoidaceae bacterium]|nr:cbb3-type cytochrome c oxidase subunit I [Dehalococcoidaceae bacterium]